MKIVLSIIFVLIGAAALAVYVQLIQQPQQVNVGEYSPQSQKLMVYFLDTQSFYYKQDVANSALILSDSAGKTVSLDLKNQTIAAFFTDWKASGTAQDGQVLPPNGCNYLRIEVDYPAPANGNLSDSINILSCESQIPDASNLDTLRTIS